MSLEEAGITHKKTDEMLVASIHFRGEHTDILLKLKELSAVCGDYVCGSPIIVYDYGVYTDGVDVEVCLPVTQAVHINEITSRMLESVEVLSLIHAGPYENVRESYQKLYSYFRDHGIAATSLGREIYLEFDPEGFENNVIELQAVLHKWDDRLSKNVERVLGRKAQEEVMKERDTFTLESAIDERAQWIKNAMECLDELADDTQKYDILSGCAHDFSEKRIADLKAVYVQTGDIDEVLKAMRKDPGWYENPIRKGNTIYVKKIPFNKDGYEKATTEIEKKKNYCHCSLIRDYLDEISPTFCYCGSGWYRQQWEGILGKSVKVEILRSLIKGDSACEMAIHLPENV